MQLLFASILALILAVAQPVLSVPALSAPVATTTGKGGKLLTVKWADNGDSPKVSAWKGINIYLATGNTDTQYKLQQLASNLSDSKTEGKYTVDASIGPSGKYYFIRMESVTSNSSGIHDMAFSAKFTLDSMTGTFNSTVASIASAATGSTSTASSEVSTTAFGITTTAATASTTTSSSSSSSSTTTSGAASSKTQQTIMLFGLASLTVAAFVILV